MDLAWAVNIVVAPVVIIFVFAVTKIASRVLCGVTGDENA
jgi:hypothetical protein